MNESYSILISSGSSYRISISISFAASTERGKPKCISSLTIGAWTTREVGEELVEMGYSTGTSAITKSSSCFTSSMITG